MRVVEHMVYVGLFLHYSLTLLAVVSMFPLFSDYCIVILSILRLYFHHIVHLCVLLAQAVLALAWKVYVLLRKLLKQPFTIVCCYEIFVVSVMW